MAFPAESQQMGTHWYQPKHERHPPLGGVSAFAKMPGSHGTRLIDYPEPDDRIYLKGRTYRYRIDLGNQSWRVYRKLRRSTK